MSEDADAFSTFLHYCTSVTGPTGPLQCNNWWALLMLQHVPWT